VWNILSYRGEIQQLHTTETFDLNLSLNLSVAGQIIEQGFPNFRTQKKIYFISNHIYYLFILSMPTLLLYLLYKA